MPGRRPPRARARGSTVSRRMSRPVLLETTRSLLPTRRNATLRPGVLAAHTAAPTSPHALARHRPRTRDFLAWLCARPEAATARRSSVAIGLVPVDAGGATDAIVRRPPPGRVVRGAAASVVVPRNHSVFTRCRRRGGCLKGPLLLGDSASQRAFAGAAWLTAAVQRGACRSAVAAGGQAAAPAIRLSPRWPSPAIQVSGGNTSSHTRRPRASK